MIINFLTTFFIGSILLIITVVVVYKTKVVYAAREKSGVLKRKIPAAGILSMLFFLSLLLAFLVGFDVVSFGKPGSYPIAEIILYNFILVTALSLFDAFVIDYLILGCWKPGFLQIPVEVTTDSMKIHIKKQLSIGWLIKIPLAVISAFLYKISF